MLEYVQRSLIKEEMHMQDLMGWVWSCRGHTVCICIYNQLFRLSQVSEIQEAWIDVDPNDESLTERVSTEKELVDYIRKNVNLSPFRDETIIFDVKNAVWKKQRFQDILE
jgi:hypothetical protein